MGKNRYRAVSARAWLLIGAATLSVALPGAASAQSANTRQVDIPSQPLDATLRQIGRQTSSEIVFAAGDVRGKRAPSIRGNLTPEEAVRAALQGTILNVRRTAQGAILIEQGVTHSGETGAGSAAADYGSADIVVTAQKRSEVLRETPQSVSVVSSADLAKLSAVQFRDFANSVPGLNFATRGPGFNQVSLRGVTTGSDQGSTVATYVDEVPYGSSSSFAGGAMIALDAGLFDLQRVEVLRGPQGTLYGASSMGGLIKYVTVTPNTARFEGTGQAGISSTRFGGINYNVAAAVNAPLVTDKLALRASGYESRDGGFVDNATLGQRDVNRSDVYGGRLDLLATPVEGLSIRLVGFAQNIDRDGTAAADRSLTGGYLGNGLTQTRQYPEYFKQEFRIASATVNYDFGPAALTSITSYQHVDSRYFVDASALFAPLLGSCCGGPFAALGLPVQLRTNKFTQEVRLSSSGQAPLEWLVGAYYTRENSVLRQSFVARGPTGADIADPGLLLQESPSRYVEYAGFADLTYHFTDKFDISAGVRYARNEQSFEQIQSGLFAVPTPRRDSSEGVWTYLANARYRFSANATAYLRYATGYRPGGPNFVTNDPVTGLPAGPLTFQSDTLRSYEVGFKADTADRTFGIDASAYYIDWKNIQLTAVRGGFGVIANAPDGANIKGAELILTARPTREFVVRGAFAYQDAKLAADNVDLAARKGERLPNVPRFTATITTDYTVASSRLAPSIGATLRFVSDRTSGFSGAFSTSITQPPLYRLPDYVALDLRAGLTLDRINLQAFVRNVFDERGELSAFTNYSPLGGPAQVTVLQPRTVGVSANVAF